MSEKQNKTNNSLHNQIVSGGYQLTRLWISSDGFTLKILQLLVSKKEKYCCCQH